MFGKCLESIDIDIIIFLTFFAKENYKDDERKGKKNVGWAVCETQVPGLGGSMVEPKIWNHCFDGEKAKNNKINTKKYGHETKHTKTHHYTMSTVNPTKTCKPTSTPSNCGSLMSCQQLLTIFRLPRAFTSCSCHFSSTCSSSSSS